YSEKDDVGPGHSNSFLNGYVAEYQKACKSATGACANHLAFFLGIMAHIVADARFDRKFVGKGSPVPGMTIPANCSNLPSIPIKKNKAERFTDWDLDICLGKSLNREMAYVSSVQIKGKYYNKCGKGTFKDLRNFGECWSCPKSRPRRTAYKVTDKRACATKNIIGEKLSRAKFRYREVHFSCPKGWAILNSGVPLCIKKGEAAAVSKACKVPALSKKQKNALNKRAIGLFNIKKIVMSGGKKGIPSWGEKTLLKITPNKGTPLPKKVWIDGTFLAKAHKHGNKKFTAKKITKAAKNHVYTITKAPLYQNAKLLPELKKCSWGVKNFRAKINSDVTDAVVSFLGPVYEAFTHNKTVKLSTPKDNYMKFQAEIEGKVIETNHVW
ncbi:MAG: hypothetical protein HOK99_03180, partial [Betaproteobacteria bacterium]|nr:hypothetical protein [Betaproteobacteria bacterium]